MIKQLTITTTLILCGTAIFAASNPATNNDATTQTILPDSAFYLGFNGGVGYAADGNKDDYKESIPVLGTDFGYKFNRYFALQAEGETYAGFIGLASLMAKFSLPLNDRLSLYAKAGPSYLAADFFGFTTGDWGAQGGIGAEIALFRHLSLDLGVAHYVFSGTSVGFNQAQIGVGIYF